MNDSDFVLVRYAHPNRGQHSVVGPATRRHYGYRGSGETFLVHRSDIEAAPLLFVPLEPLAAPPNAAPPPAPAAETAAEPEVVEEGPAEEVEWLPPNEETRDLQSLAGVTPNIAAAMRADGIQTPRDILRLSEEQLMRYRGVGPQRAKLILAGARRAVEP